MTDRPDFEALTEAFAAHELFLVYQPVVLLRDGSCRGAEALVRWRRGTSVLEASQFMPLVARTPLSGAITYWVIDTVAAELGAWLGAHPRAEVAINIPPEILGRGGIEYAVRKSALRERVHQLVLEITESGIPDQLGLDALNSIPGTGARVALDDTTLSGANLALLTRCHFDIVKIDRTLVSDIVIDRLPPAWLEGLAALLKAAPLEVVAEGVETRYQAETLRENGVQLGQGHHFAEPLSASEFRGYYELHST